MSKVNSLRIDETPAWHNQQEQWYTRPAWTNDTRNQCEQMIHTTSVNNDTLSNDTTSVNNDTLSNDNVKVYEFLQQSCFD